MAGEEQQRGAHQPAALAAIDRGRAAAETPMLAVAHFDEHHHVAVAAPVEHHQVEFPGLVARVRGKRAQAFAFEVGARRGLDVGTARAPVQRVSDRRHRSAAPGGRR